MFLGKTKGILMRVRIKGIQVCRRFVGWIKNRKYERMSSGEMRPCILSLEATMRKIIDERCSVSRFGDGEFDMIMGKDMGFQKFNAILSKRLRGVIEKPVESCLVCIPPVFGDVSCFIREERDFWRQQMLSRRTMLCSILPARCYGDAFVSRCYLRYNDKSIGSRVFQLWKELFRDKDVLVVEGRLTHLGQGDDLLEDAHSVRRIWCPPKDAFACYGQILAGVRSVAKKTDLIVLSLGATASVLAYDLSREGYWAIDAGHLDVEYHWMKMGATRKVQVPGHYTGEIRQPMEDIVPSKVDLESNNVLLDLHS